MTEESPTSAHDADIQRLAALRDSGQISADDFERLKQAILDSTASAPAASAPPDPGVTALGREKPVRPAGEQRGNAWEPAPESAREPRQAFQASIPPTPPSGEPPASTAEAASVPAVGPIDPAFAMTATTDASGGGEEPPTLPPAPPGPFERYPMRFGVLYPERLSRWKTAFRAVLMVPVLFVSFLLGYALIILAVIGWTAVFWRKKYPSWAFRGVTGILDYQARISAYQYLLTDKYPSFDRERSLVRLDFAEPQPGTLSRWRVFWWKGALLVPQLVVLYFLQLALTVVTILSWFGILFTGNYPRGMFGFATGVMRWRYRVWSYFLSLHDRYPPYALSDDASAAGNTTVVWSGVGGGVVAAAYAGIIGLVIVLAIVSGHSHQEDVSYAALKQGHVTTVALDTLKGGFLISLTGVDDPGDDLVKVLPLENGERVVVFHWKIANLSDAGGSVSGAGADLTATVRNGANTETHDYGAQFVTVGDRLAPRTIDSLTTVTVDAVFIVPDGAQPTELHFYNGFAGRGGITYRFQ